MIGTIHIAELKIDCVLGLYPQERLAPRRVVVDIELDVELDGVLRTGSIDETVDYDEVCDAIRVLAEEGRFRLIEVFAERASALILERWPRVERCRLKVCKPGSVPGASYVAVSVDRQLPRRSAAIPSVTSARLNGQVVLVTGGAQRIGAEIVRALAAAGAQVAIHCHRSLGQATALAEELQAAGGAAFVVQADLREDAQRVALISEVVARAGRLDGLVNNAALFEKRNLAELQPEALTRMLQLNTEAPLMLIRWALPHLRAASGAVINIIDNASGSRPWAEYSHYCASKAALQAITQSLAVELAPAVRVNAVGPGAILFQDWESAKRREAVLARVPMGRLGEAREVADTVVFLIAGPRYITGQIIHVDGGWSAS